MSKTRKRLLNFIASLSIGILSIIGFMAAQTIGTIIVIIIGLACVLFFAKTIPEFLLIYIPWFIFWVLIVLYSESAFL